MMLLERKKHHHRLIKPDLNITTLPVVESHRPFTSEKQRSSMYNNKKHDRGRTRSRSSPIRRFSRIPSLSPDSRCFKKSVNDYIGTEEPKITPKMTRESNQRHPFGDFNKNHGLRMVLFSRQPPVQPLKIVLLGQLPDNQEVPDRMKSLLQNIEHIENLSESWFDKVPQAPFIWIKGANINEALENPQKNTLHDENNFSEQESYDGGPLVDSLLHQLIADLPLSLSPRPEECAKREDGIVLLKSSALKLQGVLPPSMSVSDDGFSGPLSQISLREARSRYSIAVQAHSDRYLNKRHYADKKNQSDREEWTGGIRALRDSHVQLVLRQLRHIKRLNRALDRSLKTYRSSHSPESMVQSV